MGNEIGEILTRFQFTNGIIITFTTNGNEFFVYQSNDLPNDGSSNCYELLYKTNNISDADKFINKLILLMSVRTHEN